MQILTLNNIGGGGILFQCGTIPLNETFSGFITNLMMCLPGHQTFVWPFPIKKAPFENLLIHPTQVAPGAVDPSQFHRLQVSKLQLGSIHFCWIFLLLNIYSDRISAGFYNIFKIYFEIKHKWFPQDFTIQNIFSDWTQNISTGFC